MEIKGKIVIELPLVTGMGRKGQWNKQDYVIETGDRYPKKVCFSVWNDKIDLFNISVGDEVTISIDLESREYQGKWYTQVQAYKSEHQKFAGPDKKSHDLPDQIGRTGGDGPKDDDIDSLPF